MARIKEGRNTLILFMFIGLAIFATGILDSISTISFNDVPVNFNENILIIGGLGFIFVPLGIIFKVEVFG